MIKERIKALRKDLSTSLRMESPDFKSSVAEKIEIGSKNTAIIIQEQKSFIVSNDHKCTNTSRKRYLIINSMTNIGWV